MGSLFAFGLIYDSHDVLCGVFPMIHGAHGTLSRHDIGVLYGLSYISFRDGALHAWVGGA